MPDYREAAVDTTAASAVVRVCANLSEPWSGAEETGASFMDIAARAVSVVDRGEAQRSRVLLTVEDRMSRDALAALGVDATVLPCPAVHAWRQNPVPAGSADRKSIAIGSDIKQELVAALRGEIEARGYEAVVVESASADSFAWYAGCSGGIVGDVAVAALLAGRGAPAVAIGGPGGLDELVLPSFPVAGADPREIVGRLCSLTEDGVTRQRLLALEQRTFQAYCHAVRQAMGHSDSAPMLSQQLAVLRQRLLTGRESVPPPAREHRVYSLQLLSLNGDDFIREAYRQVLGRPADEDGLRHWADKLAEGTTKLQCLSELAGSVEGRYRRIRLVPLAEYLERIAMGGMGSDSLARWVELIERGAITQEEASSIVARCGGPEQMLLAIDEIRHELEWQRQLIEWLLPATQS